MTSYLPVIIYLGLIVAFAVVSLGAARLLSPSRPTATKLQSYECGAEPIIPGCTEISLRTDPEEARVPLFDTTAIHAGAATACPLDDEP